jgi:hypothetical protein
LLLGWAIEAGASVAYPLEQVPARRLPLDIGVCLAFFGLALFWTAAGIALWLLV